MPTDTPQTFEFQAEIKQLLDIVIHSLYTEKEIFVRELVSNASDALEKMRHLKVTEKAVFDDTLELEINVTTDDKAKTITIQDFGVGMTQAELVENLGTIAHSGSKAFMKALGEGDQKAAGLIGQFGVGFYSAFMVAKSVKVYTHSWRESEPGLLWTSDGAGSYAIEESPGERRGTKIVVELKDECSEFSQEYRVREIIERYSAFVSFPINLNGTRINTVQALWLRSKSEIKEEEYDEFYKFQAHDSEKPRLRLHFSADAPLSINALLFVPKDNTEKMGLSRLEPSVALYCRKVLIDARPKDLLPEWLRFLKGVVDSEDLPLNISRETMQDRSLVEKLSKVITKRFLKFLEEEAKQRPEAYARILPGVRGVFLKEGAALDFSHKDALTKLLRFESSLTDKGKTTSLADYVTRMGAEQKEIYYLVGPSREAIEAGPYLEGFRARNLEVLFCYETVDEYVMNNVREFDGKKIAAADHSDVKLSEQPKAVRGRPGRGRDEGAPQLAQGNPGRARRRCPLKRAPGRLPCPGPERRQVLVPPHAPPHEGHEQGRGASRPIAGRPGGQSAPCAHKEGLSELQASAPDKAKLVAEQILDNALISAGLLDDASAMVKRLYKILEAV